MGLSKILSAGIKKSATLVRKSGKYVFFDDVIRTAQSKGTIQKISLSKADDLFEPLLSKMDFSGNCTTYVSKLSTHRLLKMPDGQELFVRNYSPSELSPDNFGKKLSRGVLNLSQTMQAQFEKLRLLKIKNYTPIKHTTCTSITELKTLAKKLGVKIYVPKNGYDADDISRLSDALESMIKFQNANNGRIKLPKFLGLSDRLAGEAGAIDSFALTIKRSGYLRGNMDDIVFHELGHINHHVRTNIHKIGKPEELSRFGYKSYITDEFLNNSDLQWTIGAELGQYAKKSPAEFVAEVYKKLAKGEYVPDELMTRYKMYNGPEIPKEVPFSYFR